MISLCLPLQIITIGCARAEIVRGPYLQLVTPQSATIVWRTEGATKPVVRFGEAPGQLDQSLRAEAVTHRVSPEMWGRFGVPRLHSAPGRTHQYEARLDGLKPGATYYYAVYDRDRLLAGGDEQHRFTTAPEPGRAQRVGIWALGDSGTGDRNAQDVYSAMREYTAKNEFTLDLFLHVGDMAYWDGHDWQFQAYFFDMYQSTLRQTPCWPTLGNHEGHTSKAATGLGPYFDAFVLPAAGEAGGAPSGTEAYYSFDYANIHFVVLDSYDVDRSPDGDMARWLRADLAAARADWLISIWHHAPYSRGSHDTDADRQPTDMRTVFMPILEEAGVDVVLAGHSHIYERSMLMDGAYGTPTRAEDVILNDGDGAPEGDGPYRKSAGRQPHQGAVQIVTGHGGAFMFQRGVMPVMHETLLEHGSVLLEIEGDTLTGWMVDRHGAVRDRFAIVKQGEVTPTRLAHPWQPLGPAIHPSIPLFLDRVEIGIESATHWPGEEIRFTLDGSEPTPLSPLFSEPFVVTNDVSIKARAFAPARKHASPVSAKAFRRHVLGLRPGDRTLKAGAVIEPGLIFRSYEAALQRLPDFETLEPVGTGTVAGPLLEVRPREDDFALLFAGFVQIPRPGVYAFYLISDDGSRFHLGGDLVVDNDGLHPAREKGSYVAMDEGLHAVRVEFFEQKGEETLRLEFEGPGMPRQPVPEAAWWHEP